jgi:hypothetical protein
MASRSFVVYADESNTHDRTLAHRQFYGGCLLRAEDRDTIAGELESATRGLGILGEMKWRKVRPYNADRVLRVVNTFFDMVEDRRVRFRVMWLPHPMETELMGSRYGDYGYYLLYYFFLVAGFGLPRHDEDGEVLVEFFPDTLPDEPEKKRRFVELLMEAGCSVRYGGRAPFRVVRVADVDSKKHVLMQCCDVVIGAMAFLMNGRHLERRGDGTVAEGTRVRARFARHVVERIAGMHRLQSGGASAYSLTPSTTTNRGAPNASHWRLPYRQWCFSSRPLLRYSGWRRYARGSSAESRPA